MSKTVETIKERISIVDLVGSYLKLERAGNNFKARCPFHNEKTPSFFVSPDRGGYYCFGCNAKGDIFTFVEEFEGLDFKGALKVLAERAGVELIPEATQARSERDRLFEEVEVACRFFEASLNQNPKGLEYLTSRGLSKETITDFRIGFAPDAWRMLTAHLSAASFSENEMLSAGLVKESPKGVYDTFRARVMFPIADSSGRIIAFSGRILEKTDMAKYINSPETPLFSKSRILYGFDRAKKSIRLKDQAILVEGQMDLIMAQQAGTLETVASSGTALTKEHLEILKRLTNRLVIAFDADSAGVSAALRSAKLALKMGFEVKAVALPIGEDPASLILSNKEGWQKAIDQAKNIIDFYLDKVVTLAKGDKRILGKEISAKVLPYVSALDSAIEKAHYIKVISECLGVREEAVWEDLSKIQIETESGSETKNQSPPKVSSTRKSILGKKLLGIVYWQRSLDKPVLDQSKIEADIKRVIGEKKFSEIEDFYKKKQSELILEADLSYKNDDTVTKVSAELLREFEKEALQDELKRSMDELLEAERKKDHSLAMEILKRCQSISNKINHIKLKLS